MHENLVKQMRNEDSRYFENHKDAIKGELMSFAGNAQYTSDLAEKESLDNLTGPPSPAQTARHAQLVTDLAPVHTQATTRLGYMTAEQVASLEPAQLLNSAVTQGLTVPMITEIVKAEKTSLKYGKQFFVDLKAKIESNPQANKATKQFVDNASQNKSKDNPFSADYGT